MMDEIKTMRNNNHNNDAYATHIYGSFDAGPHTPVHPQQDTVLSTIAKEAHMRMCRLASLVGTLAGLQERQMGFSPQDDESPHKSNNTLSYGGQCDLVMEELHNMDVYLTRLNEIVEHYKKL